MTTANSTTETRPSALSIWLQASRPATLLVGIAPVLLGTAFAYAANGFNAFTAFLALLVAVFIQIGTNFANDYFDFKKGADTEERLGPARVTQKGWIQPEQVKKACILMFALAFLCGLALVTQTHWLLLVVGIVSILSGIAYTGGPFPLAYNGLGDIFVLIFFGPVAVVGTYYVQTLQIDDAPLIGSLTIGLLATAVLVVNNIRDRNTDVKANKKTLVVRLGYQFGRTEHIFCILAPFLITLVGVGKGLFPRLAVVVMVLLPFAMREIVGVRQKDGAALNAHLAGAAKLTALFALLFSSALLFG